MPLDYSTSDMEFLQQVVCDFEMKHGAVTEEDYGLMVTSEDCSDCSGTCKGTASCICGGSCSGTCVGSCSGNR